MRNLLLLLFSLGVLSVHAQKKPLLDDKDVIMQRAAHALDSLLDPGTKLHESIVKEGLIGRFVLQVSFRDKGDISSVFVVSAEAHDQRSQNRFKDLVLEQELPFKMPKGRQYRLEHTFDLNTLTR